MSGNFLTAVASHHALLLGQPASRQWLLEAWQWAKAKPLQQRDMQVRCA
jgi:hypothetical protein